jgi:O-antigen/teichoic acid export membrane protein
VSAVSEPRDETRAAGRGFLYTAGAKIFFVITSYGVQLVLTRLWTENEFGLFSATIATVSILTNVLIAATIQTVSKFVSEDDAAAAVRLRQGVKLQLALGITLGVAFFLLAPILADLLEDGRLAPLLRISAAVVVSYAVYAALVGSLNGRRLFSRQAGLDITFSTLRTAGLIGAAALGFGVIGAIAGFAGAAISILLMSSSVPASAGRSSRSGRSSPSWPPSGSTSSC